MREAVVLLCSLALVHCGPAANTHRFVVVAEPKDADDWQEYCARACAGHTPPGRELVDCHSVTLGADVVERLNHSSSYGVACETR